MKKDKYTIFREFPLKKIQVLVYDIIEMGGKTWKKLVCLLCFGSAAWESFF